LPLCVLFLALLVAALLARELRNVIIEDALGRGARRLALNS
jgi:hypothetical protein